MKHLTYADKSLLIDDATADALLEYAAVLARTHDADTVTVAAYSTDGQDVEATLLLDTGAPIMNESSHSTMTEPDNGPALAYLREQIELRSAPPMISPEKPEHPSAHSNILDF